MSNIREVHSKPGCMSLSSYYLNYGRHLARLRRLRGESNTYHRPKPDRQPMTYYTTHHSVLCIANIIDLACRTGVIFAYLREQGRKRGEREARVACVGRFAPPLARNSRSPRARLAFASVRLNYAKNHACSAGYHRPNPDEPCCLISTSVSPNSTSVSLNIVRLL